METAVATKKEKALGERATQTPTFVQLPFGIRWTLNTTAKYIREIENINRRHKLTLDDYKNIVQETDQYELFKRKLHSAIHAYGHDRDHHLPLWIALCVLDVVKRFSHVEPRGDLAKQKFPFDKYTTVQDVLDFIRKKKNIVGLLIRKS